MSTEPEERDVGWVNSAERGSTSLRDQMALRQEWCFIACLFVSDLHIGKDHEYRDEQRE